MLEDNMVNFNEAFDITMGHEGGYTFDPNDAGGETYRGISRRYNPSWKGWHIIDRCDKSKIEDLDIDNMVRDFYRNHYWDKMLGNKIGSQMIANEMFDTGINMGIGRAIKFLQEGLNYLNRNEQLYPDLVVDGQIGNNTINALNTYLEKDKDGYLLKIMN